MAKQMAKPILDDKLWGSIEPLLPTQTLCSRARLGSKHHLIIENLLQSHCWKQVVRRCVAQIDQALIVWIENYSNPGRAKGKKVHLSSRVMVLGRTAF